MNIWAEGQSRAKSFVVLLTAAAGFNLVWAGAATFRVLVDLPARHRLGAVAFAELSRATDLSAGLVFYPVSALGACALSCAVAMAARASASRRVRRAAMVAAICSLAVLALTTQAAPIMFRIGASANDASAVESLGDRFTFLTNFRAAFAVLAAVALQYALGECALRGPPVMRRTE